MKQSNKKHSLNGCDRIQARVFDHGTGEFLQPEIRGNAFFITQDGDSYIIATAHPEYSMCLRAGVDMKKQVVYEGDIVECYSVFHKKVVSRNRIVHDKCTGEFYVLDLAPNQCRVDMNAVSRFYTCVGNIYTKTGPQEPVYEKDVI